ncbi:Uncharacterised protein [Mycobacterium tuberculosis]|nr:Uncharacterised protein [Mycobacterium tuberculosis]
MAASSVEITSPVINLLAQSRAVSALKLNSSMVYFLESYARIGTKRVVKASRVRE